MKKIEAVKTKFANFTYDSKSEAEVAQELELLQKTGKIRKYVPHPTLPLIINGYKIGDYTPDFGVVHLDGSLEYIEVKGYATPAWKIRWKIFFALYADQAKIRLIKKGKPYRPKIIKVE